MTDIVTPNELCFERLLDAPVETVWQYLVNPQLRGRWFMGGTTEQSVGGAFELVMDHDRLSDREVPTPEKYRQYIGHRWAERITRFEPPHILAITWEEGKAGTVTFELFEAGEKTRLVLTHTGLRGRDDALDFGGGWHAHLAALEARIAGRGVADFWAINAVSETIVERMLHSG